MVELVKQNYDCNKKIYEKTKKELLENLSNDISIDHVGSTAIANMYGKNIIDILIGVNDKEAFEDSKTKLEKSNFTASKKSKDDIYQFLSSSSLETKSGDIHIHLVIKNTQRYSDFLILKKYLLKNPDESKKYSDLKIKLINLGINERKEYKKQKSEYMVKLLERAREDK